MAGETPAKQYTGLLKGFEGHCIPEDFLNKDTSHSSFYTSSSKSLHDLLHALSPGLGGLKELWTDGCDSEQIWEEMQLTNKPFLQVSKKQIKPLVDWGGVVLVNRQSAHSSEDSGECDSPRIETRTDEFAKESCDEEENSDLESSETDEKEDKGREDNNFQNDEELSGSEGVEGGRRTSKQTRASVVDDQFFKLSEMEAFLDNEDKLAMGEGGVQNEDDDDLDYFRDIPSSGDQEGIHYEDFFDPPSKDGDDAEEDYESDYSYGDSPLPIRTQIQNDEKEMEAESSDEEDFIPLNAGNELSSHQKKLSRVRLNIT
jgi:U3 small nucleolar RNA-associated protein MPP10